MIELTTQQAVAVEKAVRWFKENKNKSIRFKKPYFFLSGYAGTGKTTCAKMIADACVNPDKALFIAPTGKAASRLRAKGCEGAKTLHSFLYNFVGEDDDGDLMFSHKTNLFRYPDLIVLDEASMISEYDFRNLLKKNIPILALGDIGQLPPVKSVTVFSEDNTDYLLTDIVRQRKESNITRASFYVRQGKHLPEREYDDVIIRKATPSIEFLKDFVDADSQILCTFNGTRLALNRLLRQKLGYEGEMPNVGEKIVCTFNQHEIGFMNGEQGLVVGYSKVEDHERDDDEPESIMFMEIISLTDGNILKIKCNPDSFSTNKDCRDEAHKKIGGIDYGYLLTIHKSQGSEWSKVVILEEPFKSIPYAKLMYTAITRAVDRLWIIR